MFPSPKFLAWIQYDLQTGRQRQRIKLVCLTQVLSWSWSVDQVPQLQVPSVDVVPPTDRRRQTDRDSQGECASGLDMVLVCRSGSPAPSSWPGCSATYRLSTPTPSTSGRAARAVTRVCSRLQCPPGTRTGAGKTSPSVTSSTTSSSTSSIARW